MFCPAQFLTLTMRSSFFQFRRSVSINYKWLTSSKNIRFLTWHLVLIFFWARSFSCVPSVKTSFYIDRPKSTGKIWIRSTIQPHYKYLYDNYFPSSLLDIQTHTNHLHCYNHNMCRYMFQYSLVQRIHIGRLIKEEKISIE